MRTRHGRIVAALIAAVVLAGCSSADDPLAPHRSSLSAPPESTPTPHGAPDLEARLPTTIGGTRLQHSSFDGPTFLGTGTQANRAALTAMLGQLGHGVNDLSLAQATDPASALPFIEGIFRVAGTRPETLEPAWLAAQEAATNNRLVQGTVTVGGQSVTKLSDPNFTSGGTTYVVPRGDSLILIIADDEKLVEEAVGQIR